MQENQDTLLILLRDGLLAMASTAGTTNRFEWWLTLGFASFVFMSGATLAEPSLWWLLSGAIFWIFFATTIKRFRDLDLSVWWCLVLVVCVLVVSISANFGIETPPSVAWLLRLLTGVSGVALIALVLLLGFRKGEKDDD
ncbi:MAG: hypothetical protein ACE363_08535 [Alphaproteobacteria bacterium]